MIATLQFEASCWVQVGRWELGTREGKRRSLRCGSAWLAAADFFGKGCRITLPEPTCGVEQARSMASSNAHDQSRRGFRRKQILEPAVQSTARSK